MGVKPEELKGCKYIHVRKDDGELIASIPLEDANGDIINKKGYVVVFGYKDEPTFEDSEGKIYLVD